jgi:hypothetical protein
MRLSGKLNQTAVYWGSPTSDGQGGRTFDDPVEVSVRWDQRQDLFIDGAGQEVRSSAVVYLSQDVVLGGFLYLGTLDDISSAEEADPMTIDNAFEIRNFEKTGNVKATVFLRKAWL